MSIEERVNKFWNRYIDKIDAIPIKYPDKPYRMGFAAGFWFCMALHIREGQLRKKFK